MKPQINNPSAMGNSINAQASVKKAEAAVMLYVYPDRRLGRGIELPVNVIVMAHGRMGCINELVRRTATRDIQRQCYRLPPQPQVIEGHPNTLLDDAVQYIEWVRGLPFGKSIEFARLRS
ncbi:hypothetical protein [Halothiobacillus diazotrophicus]|nr:hypothetical protein [Halothiobacillus diazotrophicus]